MRSLRSSLLLSCLLLSCLHVAPHAQAVPIVPAVFSAAVETPVDVAAPPTRLLGAVFPSVVTDAHELQVLRPVIEGVSVDVMDYFALHQWTPQSLSHHDTMLSNVTTTPRIGMLRHFQESVPITHCDATSPSGRLSTARLGNIEKSSIPNIPTRLRAKSMRIGSVSNDTTTFSLKRLPAHFARQCNAITTTKMLALFGTVEPLLWTRLDAGTKRLPAMVTRLDSRRHRSSFVYTRGYMDSISEPAWTSTLFV